VVVVAAHAGGRCTDFRNPENLSSCQPQAEIFDVVRTLPSGLVDVVVAGHSHAGVAHRVAGTAVIESFSNGRSFGRVDVTVRRGRVTGKRIFPPRDVCLQVAEGTERCDPAVAERARWVPARYENASVRPDPGVAKVLAPVIEQVRALKGRRLGVFVSSPIVRVPDSGESPLGNLFTDVFLRWRAGVELAINNTRGGLRADLPAGPLTYGSLFEVFPFDNRLVEITLTGRQLRQVFLAQLRQTDRAGIAGLRVDAGCSSGHPLVRLIRPSGTPVGDAEHVRVVTTDFIATGGDGILRAVMPAGGFPIDPDSPLARDVVADELQRRGGTLRAVDLVDVTKPRWTGSGCR
jgi:5'-nucleotidase